MNLSKIFGLQFLQLVAWAACLVVPFAMGMEFLWLAGVALGISVLFFFLWFREFYLNMEKPYSKKGKGIAALAGLRVLFILGYGLFGTWMVAVYTSWKGMAGGIMALMLGAAAVGLFIMAPKAIAKKTHIIYMFLPSLGIAAVSIWQCFQVAYQYGNSEAYFLSNTIIITATFFASIATGLSMSINIPSASEAQLQEPIIAPQESLAQNIENIDFQHPSASLEFAQAARESKDIRLLLGLRNAQKKLPHFLFRWPDWKANKVVELKAELKAAIEEMIARNAHFQGPDTNPWCTQCGYLGRLSLPRFGGMVLCPECLSDQHLRNFLPTVNGVVGPDHFEGNEVNIWDNETQQIKPLEIQTLLLRDTEGVNLDWVVSAFCTKWENIKAQSFQPLSKVEIEKGCSVSENSIRLLRNLNPPIQIHIAE